MSTTPFGKYAQINEDGTGHTTQERLDLALTEPANPAALKPNQVKAITQNRIRSAMSELAHGNIDNVNTWLQQVATGTYDKDGKLTSLPQPAKAVELFLQLAEFTLPKMKAVQIDVRQNNGDVKSYSVKDLESIVAEQ